MEKVRYQDIGEWLVALESRKDHDLQAMADSKRRIFGFIDHTGGTFHCVGIGDLGRTRSQVLPDIYTALCDPESRRQLIEG